MASGPSKQELEMYWQSSRQYFDELAEHYRQNEPEYYKEFIQPFYSNPFRTGSGSGTGKKGGCAAKAVLAVSLFFLIAGLAVSVFFLLYEKEERSTNTREEKDNREEIISTDTVSGIGPVEETNPETSIYYRRGLKLFEQKEYKLAGRYFEKVPKSDPNYDDAQRFLMIIEAMNKKNNRKKPIERFR
jgi:tetratricopeptide (TPR) repeat protein